MPLHDERGESNNESMIGRREVCKRIGLLGSAVMLAGISSLARAMTDAGRPSSGLEGQWLPRRQLGRTGVTVPILGLGGGHLLNTSDEEGSRIVQEAIDAGLTFFDNSWDYYNNRSEAVMGKALKGHRHEVFLMTKMCTHGLGTRKVRFIGFTGHTNPDVHLNVNDFPFDTCQLPLNVFDAGYRVLNSRFSLNFSGVESPIAKISLWEQEAD
jgi:hypothetical protein